MPNRDFNRESEVITLRSGKRYKLEGKKRNTDGECKRYLEGTSNTSLWSDLEDHSVKRSETPEKPKTLEVKSVTSPVSGNNTSTATQGRSIATSFASTKKVMVGGEMKLPLFHGNGSKDPQQHWFLCEVVWRVKQVVDADMKATQLVTMLGDRALTWYMKFSGGKNKTLNEIQTSLITEFKKPKSESQCITELKEIKQLNRESTWEFD